MMMMMMMMMMMVLIINNADVQRSFHARSEQISPLARRQACGRSLARDWMGLFHGLSQHPHIMMLFLQPQPGQLLCIYWATLENGWKSSHGPTLRSPPRDQSFFSLLITKAKSEWQCRAGHPGGSHVQEKALLGCGCVWKFYGGLKLSKQGNSNMPPKMWHKKYSVTHREVGCWQFLKSLEFFGAKIVVVQVLVHLACQMQI